MATETAQAPSQDARGSAGDGGPGIVQSPSVQGAGRARRSVRVRVVAALVALVVAVGGGIAYARWNADLNARLAAAEGDLAKATSTLATAELAGRAALDGSAGKTADEQARQALAALLGQEVDGSPRGSRQERIAADTALTSAALALAGKVDEATAAVREAQAAWELAQAQAGYDQAITALAAAIDTSAATLAGSEGKVSDNTVRQTLTDALGTATTLRAAPVDPTVAALTAATAAVTTSTNDLAAATSATTDAQVAWQAEQDRIAAEQAAAAAAKAKATSGGSTSSKSGSSSSGSTGSHNPAPRLGSSSGSHPVLGDPGTVCTTPSCGITF